MKPNAIEHIQRPDGARKGQLVEAAMQVIANLTGRTDELPVPPTYFIPAIEGKFVMLTAMPGEIGAVQALAQRVLQAESAQEYAVVHTLYEFEPTHYVVYYRKGQEPQISRLQVSDGVLVDATDSDSLWKNVLNEAVPNATHGMSAEEEAEWREFEEVIDREPAGVPPLQWTVPVDGRTADSLRESVAAALEGDGKSLLFSFLSEVPSTLRGRVTGAERTLQ